MRVLLCGVIGAAAAMTAWMGLEYSTQSSYGWLAILVGIVTGLCVRWASVPGRSGGAMRGALAILITMAAIVFGRMIYVKVIESTLPAADRAVAKMPIDADDNNTDDAADGEEDATDEGDDPATPKPRTLHEQAGYAGQPGLQSKTLKSSFSEWDMLWMSLGGLAAYILGKNDGSVAVGEVAESDRNEGEPEAHVGDEDEPKDA